MTNLHYRRHTICETLGYRQGRSHDFFCFQDELLEKMKCVLRRHGLKPQQLSYDTTFSAWRLLPFFFSIPRDRIFQRPSLSVHFFHTRRKITENRRRVFSLVVSYVPERKECHNTYIATDDEAAIVSTINKFHPEIDFFVASIM